jgi:T5SS/PEP-CTERM-associated repeat protein
VFPSNSDDLDAAQIIVGGAGTGNFQVVGGARVESSTFTSAGGDSDHIGQLIGSMGVATVTGKSQQPSWWHSESLVVGEAGTGTLNVSDGGLVRTSLNAAINGTATINITTGGSIWGGLWVANDVNGNGFVRINGAGSKIEQYLDVAIIGRQGTGTLVIENQGQFVSSTGIVGDFGAANGTVAIDGPGSRWDVANNLVVGNLGSGTLALTNGGSIQAGGNVAIGPQGLLSIGSASSSGGQVTAARIVNNGTLRFDHGGVEFFSTPTHGAGLINHIGSGTTTIDNLGEFAGSVTVNSGMLNLRGSLAASSYTANGPGFLQFRESNVQLEGKTIRANEGGVIMYQLSTVDGGFLRGASTHVINTDGGFNTFNGVTTFNSTNFIQNGGVGFFNNFTNGGTLANNAGAMYFDGFTNSPSGIIYINTNVSANDFTNSGVINVGATGVLNGGTTLANGGGSRTYVAPGGRIDSVAIDLNGALLVNNGTITSTVNIYYGALAKGTGSYGAVHVFDGGMYAPGSSPGVVTAQSVTFENTASTTGGPLLSIEIGGVVPGAQYDQLHVAGNLHLSGTLAVHLSDIGSGLFEPEAGHTFDILDWSSLSGQFTRLILPELSSGLNWDISQLYLTGELSVSATALAGDFNHNGVVDGADYVVWRKGLGTAYTQADYGVWRANFGRTGGSGSGGAGSASATVPEPATLALFVFAALMVARTRELRIPLIRR